MLGLSWRYIGKVFLGFIFLNLCFSLGIVSDSLTSPYM